MVVSPGLYKKSNVKTSALKKWTNVEEADVTGVDFTHTYWIQMVRGQGASCVYGPTRWAPASQSGGTGWASAAWSSQRRYLLPWHRSTLGRLFGSAAVPTACSSSSAVGDPWRGRRTKRTRVAQMRWSYDEDQSDTAEALAAPACPRSPPPWWTPETEDEEAHAHQNIFRRCELGRMRLRFFSI